MKKLLTLIIFLSSFLFTIVNCPAQDWKTQVIEQLNGGAALVQNPSGHIVFSHNADKQLVPASILKVATASAILSHLGEDYRIPTEFYLTSDNYLAIKGFGDPTLVSESLAQIAQQLKKHIKEPGKLQGFWLDSSFFKPRLKVHGQSNSDNPYDSSIGALVANFNTIHIRKSKTGVISSAEKQTPLTATAVQLAEKLPPGKHRINIGKDPDQTLRYFSELLQAFLKAEKIEIPLHIINKPIPVDSIKLFTHQSQAVSDIIERLFKFSNNLIANQLLIILGGKQKGPPADMDKGKQVLTDFLINTIGINNFTLKEGSGLSRKNHISAAEMMKVLIHFQRYQNLLRLDQKHFLAKTGTLKGISTYAGYMLLPSGENYPFVILLNKARRYSDRMKVAELLYRSLDDESLY